MSRDLSDLNIFSLECSDEDSICMPQIGDAGAIVGELSSMSAPPDSIASYAVVRAWECVVALHEAPMKTHGSWDDSR